MRRGHLHHPEITRCSMLVCVIVWLSTALNGWSQFVLQEATRVEFASVAAGRAILGERDEFVERLSRFDRSARLKSEEPVDEATFLAFVRASVRAWSPAERALMEQMLTRATQRLANYAPLLPPRITFIKTSGEEEGGASYTRGASIIWPESRLKGSVDALEELFYHELFHVISRERRVLRDQCYAVIGFVPCNEVELPESLAVRRLTNPDAPRHDHCLELQIGGRSQWAIPILLADSDRYSRQRGGEFFQYLQFRWLLVARDQATQRVEVLLEGGVPQLREMTEVERFYEQVGRNTGYVIHPDEILADNFRHVVLGQGNVPSPQIIQSLRETLLRRVP